MSHESQPGEERIPEKKENANAEQTNPKPERANTPISVIPTKPNLAPPKGQDCCKKYKRIKVEIKDWFEIFGIIAGIAVLIVLIGQYREMVVATKVTNAQLAEMKEARQEDERAWVFPFDSETDTNGETWVVFKLIFKNTGKTPAVNGVEWHGVANNINDVPANLGMIQTNSIMIAPDSTCMIEFAATKGTIWNIKNGLPFYVYGKLSYNDIFGNSHWTQFCWCIDRNLNFKPAPVHNSSDDAKGQNN